MISSKIIIDSISASIIKNQDKLGGKRLLATSVQTFTILKCGASTKNLQLMNDKLPEWL